MINSKWNLTLVGGFVLLAVGSLILVLAVLAGRTGDTDTYYTVYSNVSGLKFGSKVLFEGYPVGQVEEIEPTVQEGRLLFRVRMSVTEGWKIPQDSVARSEASGLLAPQTIVIVAGRSPAALEPGATITPGGMGGLMSSVQSLTGNIDELTDRALLPLVENINQQVTLFGKLMQEDLRPLVQSTNKTMAAASTQLPGILRNAEATSANLARASQRADQFLSPARMQALDRTMSNAEQTMLSLRNSSQQLEQAGPELLVALRELRVTMESLSRRSEGISQNLETSTRNLQEFSRQIRRSPGSLLRQPDPPREDGPPADVVEKKP